MITDPSTGLQYESSTAATLDTRNNTTYTLRDLSQSDMSLLTGALQCYARCLTQEDDAGHSISFDIFCLLQVFPEKFRARCDYIRQAGGTLEMLLEVLIADIHRDVAIHTQGEVTEASYTETQADALQTAQRLQDLLK